MSEPYFPYDSGAFKAAVSAYNRDVDLEDEPRAHWRALRFALQAAAKVSEVEARADERAKVLRELGLREEPDGCVTNDGGTCVLKRCVRA